MSDEKKMRALYEALADHVESLSDEQLLVDVRESGGVPEQVASEARNLIKGAVKKFKQRALAAARAQHQRNEAQLAVMKFKLPTGTTERRQLLSAVIAHNQQAGRMLIAQHRDFKEMTDDDVESWLQQFGALGLLDAERESDQ